MDVAQPTHAVGDALPLSVGVWTPVRRLAALIVAIAVAAALAAAYAAAQPFIAPADPPRPPTPLSPLRALSDLREVSITVTTASWTNRKQVVTVDTLRTDHRLWRRMYFGDWDRVPADLRGEALRLMVRSYGYIFDGPPVWRGMSADDWDAVPQPIRAIAYLRMIWYWAREEALGAEFTAEPTRLASTVAAIVMAESWFEHRALNENAWGNRDLGLAQCSDHCRATLAEMALAGELSFSPLEVDHFNPWAATHVAVVWFERELLRSGGDVELAVRAYHRGQANAMDEKADAYLATVLRLRDTYIVTQRASASWRALARMITPHSHEPEVLATSGTTLRPL